MGEIGFVLWYKTLPNTILRQKIMTEEKAKEMGTEVARSEVQEYLYLRQQRRRLFPLAALVGLCAGVVAILFRGALSSADTLRNLLLTKAHEQPIWGWIFP